MSEEIKFDHFKDINELLEHIDLWYKEDDIEYTRWFGLEDLYNLKIYIKDLQQKVEQLEKENKKLNNIINELEKYIKEKSIYYNTSDGCQWVDQFKVLDKLKKLKDSD